MPFAESKLSRAEARCAFGLPHSAVILLSVGSLKPIKGTDVLISAFGHVLAGAEVPSAVHLVLAGAGDVAQYEQRAAAANLGGSVTFLGHVPNERIPDLYRACDGFVLASRLEGQPIALLEAAFNRMPCIVTALPGLDPEWHDERSCLIVPVGDPRSLAVALRRMVEDDTLRDVLGRNARDVYDRLYAGTDAFERLWHAFQDAATKSAGGSGRRTSTDQAVVQSTRP